MFVATRSGSVFKVQLPSLEVLEPSLPVCGSAQNCCSAMLNVSCSMQAAAGLLVVADRVGAMYAMQLAKDAPDNAVHGNSLAAAAPEGFRGAVSGVLRLSVAAASESFSLPLGAEASPSLAEAEKAIVEQVFEHYSWEIRGLVFVLQFTLSLTIIVVPCSPEKWILVFGRSKWTRR